MIFRPMKLLIGVLLSHVLYTCHSFTLFANSVQSTKINQPINETLKILTNTSQPTGSTIEPNMIISFVNGISHTIEDWNRITNQLKTTFKAEVKPFFYPSSGSYIQDISSIGFELWRRSADFIVAKDLAEHLRRLLNEVGPDGRVYHIAHSGGAIVTYLAAKYHLTNSERNRIDVVTFGAGKSITHKYFKGRVRNYYAKNDPVLQVDSTAWRMSTRFASSLSASASPCIEIVEPEYNTSYVFLTGLLNNAIMDHSMEGPTYGNVLMIEAKEFHARKSKLVKQSSAVKIHKNSLMRAARKRIARLTGWHRFWNDQKPTEVIVDYARVRMSAALPAVMASYPVAQVKASKKIMRNVRKQFAKWTGWHGVWSKHRNNNINNNCSVSSGGSGSMSGNNSVARLTPISTLLVPSGSVDNINSQSNNHYIYNNNINYNINNNNSLTLLPSPFQDALEDMQYNIQFSQYWWSNTLNEGAKQLMDWTAPARNYIATSLVSDVNNTLNAIASLPQLLHIGGEGSITSAVVNSAVNRELNLSILSENISIPSSVRLLLIDSTKKQYNSSDSISNSEESESSYQYDDSELLDIISINSNNNSSVSDAMRVSEKDAYVRCQLSACYKLGRLSQLVASNTVGANPRVALIAGALSEALKYSDAVMALNESVRLLLVNESFNSVETSQLLTTLTQLHSQYQNSNDSVSCSNAVNSNSSLSAATNNSNCSNTTFNNNNNSAVSLSVECKCIRDAKLLMQYSVERILECVLHCDSIENSNTELLNMMHLLECKINTEGGKLLAKQRIETIKALLKEVKLTTLLDTIDVE